MIAPARQRVGQPAKHMCGEGVLISRPGVAATGPRPQAVRWASLPLPGQAAGEEQRRDRDERRDFRLQGERAGVSLLGLSSQGVDERLCCPTRSRGSHLALLLHFHFVFPGPWNKTKNKLESGIFFGLVGRPVRYSLQPRWEHTVRGWLH